MRDALLEIGVENLPARFIEPALAQMKARIASLMKEERLWGEATAAEAFGTPRRLTLLIRGVPEKSDEQEIFAYGPPAKLLKDERGGFTPQALGFAKSNGVGAESLVVEMTDKGERIKAVKVLPCENAAAVLARVLPALIEGLAFPKSLVWNDSGLRFGRPIRWLLALYGKRVVAFKLAGLRSGDKTSGLAATGSKVLKIADPGRYLQVLKNQCVLADVEARRAALLKSLDELARKAGARIDKDPALVEEIVFLTEHPVPVAGKFDKAYLELPQALLTTVLKKQLKFFPLLDARGALEPGFVGVRDGISEGQALVRDGYERVLEARFSDAHFFHGRDLQTKLEEKLPRLEKVAFQKGLGSMKDKSERVERLAEWLFNHVSPVVDLEKLSLKDLDTVKRVARLAYADLVTEVVKEFPELQGAMGGHYCRKDGEDERVAQGVEEFYFPAGAKAPLPGRLESCIVSLAGKLDTLAAMFLAGNKPSGSEDPFGLRRQGTGVARIVLEKQLPLDLAAAAGEAVDSVHSCLSLSADKSQGPADLREFLWQRAETLLVEMGYPIDEVRAVSERALENLPRALKRLASLHAIRPNSAFGELATSFKRASNMLKQAGVNGGAASADAALFAADAERELHEALGSVGEILTVQVREQRFDEALTLLVGLKPKVDRFFEDVLVLDKDERLKNNRLALLSTLVRLFKSVADLSQIQA